MQIRKIIRKRMERHVEGIDAAADVNAVIAANVGERGQSVRVSSRQTAGRGRKSQGGNDAR